MTMAEIFKPRENMKFTDGKWQCRDENGNFICDGGPSEIWDDGFWEFYDSLKGHHRLDGPAVSSGEWAINGENVTTEIHAFAEENSIDLNNLTDEDKVIIALKFG